MLRRKQHSVPEMRMKKAERRVTLETRNVHLARVQLVCSRPLPAGCKGWQVLQFILDVDDTMLAGGIPVTFSKLTPQTVWWYFYVEGGAVPLPETWQLITPLCDVLAWADCYTGDDLRWYERAVLEMSGERFLKERCPDTLAQHPAVCAWRARVERERVQGQDCGEDKPFATRRFIDDGWRKQAELTASGLPALKFESKEDADEAD
jgi:hypothetical protein